MRFRNRAAQLKALFYFNLMIVLLLVGYKVYLNLSDNAFSAVHTEEAARLTSTLAGRDAFSFAVVGNINNSVGIFEERIIPMLNADVDFMVSAGNAVSNGSEDKYRALYGSLSHLQIPYLLTFGKNEYQNFGSFRFYDHFGPHFYSIRAGNSRLIFLDSTSKTPWQWQVRWLTDLLNKDDARHKFVFVGHPLLPSPQETLFVQPDDYLAPEAFQQALLELFKLHRVDAVFSANMAVYSQQEKDGTWFVTTGGAGGLVLNDELSFYHFVKVDVDAEGQVSINLQPLEVGQHPVLKRLESLWFFIYSLFYVGYLNFILLVSVFILIVIKLYVVVFVGRDYYPDYDLDPAPWLSRPLRVAMFTNNYLPFIGGVPISIERLKSGLQSLGDQVLIVAPRYKEQADENGQVVRVPALLTLGAKREFRMANIFLSRIRRAVRSFKPDIIHVHHPFWLGTLGLFIARRLNVPAVYTYHTRLEHYAHFVPLPGSLFRNLISHELIRHFANKCDAVIVPTDSTEEYLRMIGVKTPSFVQPTGIEYQRFQAVRPGDVDALRQRLQLAGNEKVLISVSRLSNEKNIDFMIDAIAALREQTDTPFRFLMIGDGHQRDRLQQRIEQYQLADRFVLVGAIPPNEMATWYRLGDVFVFASRSETQGMVILEAMAAGLPVVAVRSSGIDDVVRQGFNGFKTVAKQEPWRAKVQLLLEDDALRAELSEHALAFAKDFSVDQFARDIRLIYATALASRASKESAQATTA
ncbi:glycosyltransferase [Marinobacter sp. X15-166B]|uniref:glycosyltransferase n=1 Tax=Marinobacter sp. X15-166B TaxID=1897620 RepID=UPI00085C0471|nr:glycosyltransferase [Marinobacter sp. X15-166B]OEY65471.1 glycosyl transferase family 1 [Marinobacter sp. X15-166B]